MELLTEDQVIVSLITYLELDDWKIISYCMGHDRGYDIVAEKDSQRMYVEAKGAKGNDKAHNTVRRKFDSGQIKDHLGKALIKSFETQNKFPNAIVAIAHPDDAYIRSIIGDVIKNINSAGIKHFWVDLAGNVKMEG